MKHLVLVAAAATLAAAEPTPVRILVWDKGAAGYLDATGTLALPYAYKRAAEFRGGFACVDMHYIDVTGKAITADVRGCWPFSEGLARVQLKQGVGFVDAKGKTFLVRAPDGTPITDSDDVGDFHGGLARVAVAGQWGWISPRGAWAIAPTYGAAVDDNTRQMLDLCAKGQANEGMACNNALMVQGMARDATGDFAEGLAAVKVDETWGFITPRGKLAIAPTLHGKPGPFSDGLTRVGDGGQYSYADRTGKVVIAGPFYSADDFHDGLAAVTDEATTRFIDATGKTAFTLPAGARLAAGPSYFAAGRAPITDAKHKVGYVDRTGAWVIRPVFDGAAPFVDGFAMVELDRKGTRAVIDPTGKAIWVTPGKQAAFDALPR